MTEAGRPVTPGTSVQIAPSLLSADLAHLADQIRLMEQAGADRLHLDVMDGRFVPNLSFGVPVVEAVRRVSRLPLEVHLMIVEPERYVKAFRQAGADWLLVHAEAGPHLHRLLQTVRASGAKTGVVLNPATPAEELRYVLGLVDQVLVMTVNPGFGGQAFLPEVLPKVRQLREEIERTGRTIDLEVDGGIDPQTISAASAAGANVVVAGSAIFAQPEPALALQRLRQAARAGVPHSLFRTC